MTRTVTVALRASNAQFDQAYVTSAGKVQGLERATSKATAAAGRHSASMASSGRDVMVAGGVMAAGFLLAERATMSFDKELSNLKASVQGNAATMGLLRAAALQTGKDTQFSATQAAQAETALAKAGVSVKDILGGGLKGATDLAAAGQLDVASAAEIAATAMVQFKLHGKDVPHIADLLAAGAGKAQGEVTDMAMALKYVGPVAGQMGVSIEQTAGSIAFLASNGILGEQAGTSLRGMLTALTSPSKLAAKEMEHLGISMYDSRGHFIGLEGIAGQLHNTLGRLTETERDNALGRIFGNEQITAARVLYSGGAEAVRSWTKAVNDQGYATDTAATKMDNLSGDVERLKGSFETALISGGSGATAGLRKLTQGADEAVGAYIALPHAMQTGVTVLSGVAGAAGLVGGAFMVAAPKVAAFKASLETAGPKSQMFGNALLKTGGALSGPLGLALAGGVIALGIYGKAKADAAAEVETFTRAIGADSGALGENTRQTVVNSLEKRGILKTASDLGLAMNVVTDAAMGNTDAMRDVYTATAGLGDIQRGEFLTGVVAVSQRMNEGSESAKRQADALKATGDAAGGASGAQGSLAPVVESTTRKIQKQAASLTDLLSAYQKVTDHILGLRDANRGYEAAIDDATKALKANGRTLDIHTEKGRANSAALDDIAKNANSVLKGLVDNGAQLPRVTSQFHAQHGALVRVAEGFGMTAAEAKAYADSVLKIPPTVKTKATVDTTAADQHVVTLLRKLEELDGKSVTTSVETIFRSVQAAGSTGPVGPIRMRAAGGLLPGAPSRTDNMVIAAATGEYVVNAHQTKKHLTLLEAINKGLPGFATGGQIGIPRASTYNPSTSLSSQALAIARGGGSADDIRARTAAYDEYLHRLDQVAQREKLVADLRQASAEAAKASSSTSAAAVRQMAAAQERLATAHAKGASTAAAERQVAAAQDAMTKAHTKSTQDAATAQQRVTDAVRALRDFDQAARIEQDKAATDRLIASLEKRAAAEQVLARRQDNAYTVGQRTAKDELAGLDKRLAAELKYSDTWMALYNQRKQVLEDVASAQAKRDDAAYAAQDVANLDRRLAATATYTDAWIELWRQRQRIALGAADAEVNAADAVAVAANRAAHRASDAMDAALGQYSTSLGRLNGLLREADAIQKKQTDSREQFASKQQDLLDRQSQAESTLYDGMAKAAADYATAERQLLAGREQALAGWASISERATAGWGNTLDQLNGNVQDQIGAFREWMERLADARARGVDEAVITALGLDEGPQALGQLRQFSAATTTQIDALNAAVAARTALAGAQAHAEQVGRYGQLAKDLATAQQQYTESVMSLQQQYQSTQADLAAQLRQAEQDFLTEQTQLAADLAAVGTDQALAYGEALAAGLRSQIPGVRAAAEALLAAAGNLAGAQAGAAGPATAGAPGAPTTASSSGPSGALTRATITSMRESQWTVAQRATADKFGWSGVSVFDSGGWLQPGLTLAYNGTGQPERVATAAQSTAPQAVNVQVFVGDREITDIVDVRIDSTLGTRRAKAEIAGAR